MVHFSEFSTVAANHNTETQIEMRDGTVERFPELEHGPEYPRVARHCRLVGVQREEVSLRRPDEGRAHAEHRGEGVEGDGVWFIKL